MNLSRIAASLWMVGVTLLASLPGYAYDDVGLKLIGKSGTPGQDAVWYFKLSVARQSTLYLLVDRTKVSGPETIDGVAVRLAPYQMEERSPVGWKALDLTFCPDATPLALRPGQELIIKVEDPETTKAWRIGVKVYAKTPAANVPAADVWSDAIPATSFSESRAVVVQQ